MAEARISQAESGASDTESRVADAEARAAQADVRAAEAEARASAAEQRAADADGRINQAELRATEAETRASEGGSGPDVEVSDSGRVHDLERQNAELALEVEHMGNRLRRAYADAEEARAQLVSGGGSSAGLGGNSDEETRLRRELAQAMERAQAAENRASQLQADLADARVRAGEDPEPPAQEEIEEDEGPSLRFRLAQAAARKRGISGGVGGPGGAGGSSDEPSMWS
jgi:hypothetical protein